MALKRAGLKNKSLNRGSGGKGFAVVEGLALGLGAQKLHQLRPQLLAVCFQDSLEFIFTFCHGVKVYKDGKAQSKRVQSLRLK